MPNPKRKLSKSWQMMRRSHLALKESNLSVCPRCHQPKLPHRVCGNCGYYKGKEVIKL
ncbi:MAG: 50S ribosomal protein L32 [Planctomycetes bacterium]|nr:50S ribosomal protein L32 [Planctomycetota bacterium]